MEREEEEVKGDSLGDIVFLVLDSGAAIKANPVLSESMRRNAPSANDSLTMVITLLPSKLLLTVKEKSTST